MAVCVSEVRPSAPLYQLIERLWSASNSSPYIHWQTLHKALCQSYVLPVMTRPQIPRVHASPCSSALHVTCSWRRKMEQQRRVQASVNHSWERHFWSHVTSTTWSFSLQPHSHTHTHTTKCDLIEAILMSACVCVCHQKIKRFSGGEGSSMSKSSRTLTLCHLNNMWFPYRLL